MNTWILILTLVAPSVNGGSAIEHIPGFHSEEACVTAGNHWLKNKPSSWSNALAICVKQ